MSEHGLINWIRRRIGTRRGRILVDSGDDAAVVRVGAAQLLLKTDSVIDGVHFDSRTARPEDVGHKAIARCLSDIAAMGCYPAFAVVALMVPHNARESWIKKVLGGLERTAKRFGTAIVGGDVASHAGKLAINVALLGETRGRRPIRRNGAKTGDLIAVTGPLGGSLLGKHLRFTPRVKEALELGRRFDVHAMIDLSDGLATDLGHLCRESGAGAVLDPRAIPVSADAKRMARKDRRSPLDHALADGEDYELLFTLPAAQGDRLRRSRKGVVIGEIVGIEGMWTKDPQGRLHPLKVRGWEHRFRS